MIKFDKVKIKWYKNNKKYYTAKGYSFTNFGEEFEISVIDLPKGSCILVEYICDYCHGENQKDKISKFKEYKVLLRCRKSSDKDCCGHKECKYKKLSEAIKIKFINEKGSIEDKYPNLINEWNYLRNEGNPNEYPSDYSHKIWWVCSKGHEWEDTLNKRINKHEKCPICENEPIFIDNSLSTHFPKIAKEWHPTKNGDLTPFDVSKSSRNRVWWKCENSHEWENSVNSRTNNLSKCPYCPYDMTKILTIIRPDIALEWHPTKNNQLKPSDFTYGSRKKVWWECNECQYEWESEIKTRTLLESGCPRCNESKGEKKIREFLECEKINYIFQKEFDGLTGINGGNLSYDFYLPKKNILIEYQGEFHDGKLNDYVRENLGRQQEHDKRKKEYAIQNKINLLEIWYWDFEDIEEILSKELLKQVRFG